MTDIERAEKILKSEKLTCVVCKADCVYKSELRGVAPLMKLLDGGIHTEGFCAADKVIGKAAAFLMVLCGISEVYAVTVSDCAAEVLKSYGIKLHFEQKVEFISNRAGDGRCPMEESVLNIDDPYEALQAIKATQKRLREGK